MALDFSLSQQPVIEKRGSWTRTPSRHPWPWREVRQSASNCRPAPSHESPPQSNANDPTSFPSSRETSQGLVAYTQPQTNPHLTRTSSPHTRSPQDHPPHILAHEQHLWAELTTNSRPQPQHLPNVALEAVLKTPNPRRTVHARPDAKHHVDHWDSPNTQTSLPYVQLSGRDLPRPSPTVDSRVYHGCESTNSSALFHSAASLHS